MGEDSTAGSQGKGGAVVMEPAGGPRSLSSARRGGPELTREIETIAGALVSPSRQLLSPPRGRGFSEYLGLGGVRMNRRPNPAETQACSHCDGDLADHLPGVLGNERSAEDPVGSLVQVNPQEAFGLAVEDRTVYLVHGDRKRVHLEARGERVLLVHADMRHLRTGVRRPWNNQPACSGLPIEECVLHHDTGQRVRRVSELKAGADVAGGVDSAVRGPEPIVHPHTLPIVADIRSLQVEPLDIGHSVSRDEDLITLHRLLTIRAM